MSTPDLSERLLLSSIMDMGHTEESETRSSYEPVKTFILASQSHGYHLSLIRNGTI